jgi:hypothetical protein
MVPTSGAWVEAREINSWEANVTKKRMTKPEECVLEKCQSYYLKQNLY